MGHATFIVLGCVTGTVIERVLVGGKKKAKGVGRARQDLAALPREPSSGGPGLFHQRRNTPVCLLCPQGHDMERGAMGLWGRWGQS